ncbi:hypothetical protein ONZ45_g7273 [Pleurotus djamor]|nr:hypothetical protein ONZ45_g7273 [Pleurotus djamor]
MFLNLKCLRCICTKHNLSLSSLRHLLRLSLSRPSPKHWLHRTFTKLTAKLFNPFHLSIRVIGINYLGQPNELRGCINDAKRVRDFLYHPRRIPTRENIIDAMRWLVRSAKQDDSLFFHYSGHGGQTPDLDGDEVDGYDETIFPVDYQQAGQIIDDTMHEIMVKPLPRGCRLTALFDCCHSGSALDLPYIYSSSGRLKGSHVTSRAQRRKYSPADVISFSGCEDGQTSADTFAGGVAVGAMSHAFMTSLRNHPKQSYHGLLRSVREILYPQYSQKPQLASSHHIDTGLEFVF